MLRSFLTFYYTVHDLLLTRLLPDCHAHIYSHRETDSRAHIRVASTSTTTTSVVKSFHNVISPRCQSKVKLNKLNLAQQRTAGLPTLCGLRGLNTYIHAYVCAYVYLCMYIQQYMNFFPFFISFTEGEKISLLLCGKRLKCAAWFFCCCCLSTAY